MSGKLDNLVTVVKDQLLKLHDLIYGDSADVNVKRITSDDTIEEISIPNIAKIRADLLSAGSYVPLTKGNFSIVSPYRLFEVVPKTGNESSFLIEDNNAYVFEVEVYAFNKGIPTLSKAFASSKCVVTIHRSGETITVGTYDTDGKFMANSALDTPEWPELRMVGNNSGDYYTPILFNNSSKEVEGEKYLDLKFAIPPSDDDTAGVFISGMARKIEFDIST